MYGKYLRFLRICNTKFQGLEEGNNFADDTEQN